MTTVAYRYDESGAILEKRQTAPGTGETVWSYQGVDLVRLEQQVSESEEKQVTSFTYGGGRLVAMTGPDGKTTTFSYGSEGDLLAETRPGQDAVTFVYDPMGRPTSVKDAAGSATTTSYDVRGRVTRVTGPDGASTTFGYDSAGRLQTATDPLRRTTRYAYDGVGRVVGVIDPMGVTTSTTYDRMSRTVALTDGERHRTRFEHDGYGRVVKTTDPGGASESLVYDDAGRLVTKTDRNGTSTTYEYDVLDRLVRKRYSDATPDATYTYDQAGRPLTASNGVDTLTWSYDLAGDLLSEASARAGATLGYTYDGAGRRKSVSLDGAGQVSYAYDAGGRLSTLTAGSREFGLVYDNASRRTELRFPNGVTSSYGYDELSRLVSVDTRHGATAVSELFYEYDRGGNRTLKRISGLGERYGYDRGGRLASVRREGAGTGQQSYAYDRVGNRVSEQGAVGVLTGQYDGRNRLRQRTAGGKVLFRGELDEAGTVTIDGRPAQMTTAKDFEQTVDAAPGTNQVSVEARDFSGNVGVQRYQVDVAAGSVVYSYDANGNLATKVEGTTTWGYEWNAENQLKRVTKDGAEVARFAYDPLGRRVEKVAGGVTYGYLYDGQDILKETRSDGTVYTYVHGPGIDEPLARVDQAGSVAYYHADGLGSIAKMTDGNGNVIQTRQYDAWGNLEVGADQPGYAFTGREWDPETGLYYYRARYYDPKIGRFISEDPIGFLAGVNFYGYTFNNPARFIDPSGLDTVTIGGGGSVAVLGGGGAQGGITVAVGQHAPSGWPVDVGVTGAIEAEGGLAVTASAGVTWEFGNLGNSYEAVNFSTPTASCSLYRSGRGSAADALYVGVGPGAGVTLAKGETRTVYVMRDIVLPLLGAMNRAIRSLLTPR